MYAEFEHADYESTTSYRYDTVLASAPETVVHTQTEPKVQHAAVPSTTPQRYRSPSLTKPNPETTPSGQRVIRVTAINAFGASSPVNSASFVANAPGPVNAVTVQEPQL